MKKVFVGFLSFVLGAYIALSITNVFAFNEPTENPPAGNVTPEFSQVTVGSGGYTSDQAKIKLGKGVQVFGTLETQGDITSGGDLKGRNISLDNRGNWLTIAKETIERRDFTVFDSEDAASFLMNPYVALVGGAGLGAGQELNISDGGISTTGDTEEIVFNADVRTRQNFNVDGDLSIEDDKFSIVHNNGNTRFSGDGSFTFANNTGFTGNLSMGAQSTLNVSGPGISATNDINLKKNTVVSGNITGENVIVNDDLDVKGTLKKSGNLGNIVQVEGGLHVDDGGISTNGNIQLDGHLSNPRESFIQIRDDLQLTGKINNPSGANNGDVVVNDNLKITGNNTFTVGGGGIASNDPARVAIVLKDNVRVDGELDIRDEIKNNGGDFVINDTASIYGDVHVNGDKQLTVFSNKDAVGTDINSGALRIKNGSAAVIIDSNEIMSMGDKLYINNDNSRDVRFGKSTRKIEVEVQGDFVVTDDLSVKGEIGRFYLVHNDTALTPNVIGSADAVCSAGSVRTGCSMFWTANSGAAIYQQVRAVGERTCSAQAKTARAGQGIAATAYCFDPEG